MLHYAEGPSQRSRVAPIAASIPSSNAGERGLRVNAECGNWFIAHLYLENQIFFTSH